MGLTDGLSLSAKLGSGGSTALGVVERVVEIVVVGNAFSGGTAGV